MNDLKQQLSKEISRELGLNVSVDSFTSPPNIKLGDFALPCFELAKQTKKEPNEMAQAVAGKLKDSKLISTIEAAGPYVNITIKEDILVKCLIDEVLENKKLGLGAKKKRKLMVEFAHPNTHKSFHIGHLRNIITGESVVRILENAGYKVTRTNYQGDVGMHIAKALWGIEKLKDEFVLVKDSPLEERMKFLGKAYAFGSQNYEKNDETKNEIHVYNEKIYAKDASIKEVYEVTRKWSLDYFDNIYKRVGTKFDRLYFESEVFNRGREMVNEFVKQDVFKKSEGAIIFEGEKFGLHSRVFINSKGLPTYEAKDLALAEKQFKEYNVDQIIHVVGKEQTEYFKVVFKALEQIMPESVGKEFHLAYGWVSLKHGKMSSRTGQVVLGEWLLDEIEKKISEIVARSEVTDKDITTKRIAVAAVKYAMLKVGVKVDMSFDIEESINLSGDSGPYLLYIGARINSILEKAGSKSTKITKGQVLHETERKLILDLMKFSEVLEMSAEELDPSRVAKYLFELAQDFNDFYTACPIVKAEENVRNLRINLIKSINLVMKRGLYLLGIESVERM